MSVKSRNFGKNSEILAADFLQSQGYTIIELNYRCNIGEIDIIAKHGETLVFAEVKARNSYRRGTPKEALSYTKRRRISQIAMFYLKKTGQMRVKARFDVIAVHPSENNEAPRIELIKNAFELAGF
jgi:putative endonuclease